MKKLGILLLVLIGFSFAAVGDFTVVSSAGDTINLYEHLDQGQYIIAIATNYN